MHHRKKPTLLATLAVLAVAVMAPAAQADPVEVLDYFVGGACSSVAIVDNEVDGGCVVEYQSVGMIDFTRLDKSTGAPPPNSDPNRCYFKMKAHVDEFGEGALTDIDINNSPLHLCEQLNIFPLRTSDNPGQGLQIPWPLQISHDGAGNQHMDVQACLRNPYFDATLCGTVTLDIQSYSTVDVLDADHSIWHSYTITDGWGTDTYDYEYDGYWETTDNPNTTRLEINNL